MRKDNEARTRRRRHDRRRAPGPACHRRLRRDLPGGAPGPSTFGCRHAGPCPSSPRSLFLSRLPLGALPLSLASSASPRRRASRIPPVRALSRLLGFALVTREPVFPPHALWPRPAFFRCSPERPPLDHQRAAGRGAKDPPKRPGSIERTDARDSRRRRRRTFPLCPAGQPSSRAPAHHRLRSRVRTLSYRRKGKASEKKAPQLLAPTTGKGADSSRRLPRRNWRQKIRATPLAAPELQRPHHATDAKTRRNGVDLHASL